MADQSATTNWQRYEYGRSRGHRDYCAQAKRCERFYLGGGLQWDEEVKEALGDRLATEINEIMPAVNTALGHQIHNRMDIAFQPRSGDADQAKAEVFSKVAKQIADNNKLPWVESQVFGDGMIQQRGYFDVRMDFTDSIFGEVRISALDPLDVLPDPDAKDYDPDSWGDVTITRWMTFDDIEGMFGREARIKAEAGGQDEPDHGDETDDEGRPKFGASGIAHDATFGEFGVQRRRIIDRQFFQTTLTRVAVYPSGDFRPLPDDITPDKLEAIKAEGGFPMRRMVKRVRRVVSTWDTTLFEDWSPLPFFTVVPFFAFFRRGQTRGMVDNAISPQEVLNKSVSQFVHIVNTSANSGWTVEQNSLTNMTTEDLEENGSKNGLVVEHKEGSKPPEKIKPNQVPSGIDRLIDRAAMNIKETTGISDALKGMNGPEVSGVAIQAKQFWGQQQLAVPLDNLARTRHLLACRIRDLVQMFYDTERMIRITGDDGLGNRTTEEITINQFDPETGGYLNDLTVGEYDVVISEQPIATTWENTQFQQALELRKVGVNVPDHVVIKHSTLTDKQEVIQQMQSSAAPDPVTEAKVTLINAQAEKTKAEATNASVEGMFSATQAARNIAATPAVAPLADTMLRSAGFQDKDAAPILPSPQPGMAVAPPPKNTNPLTPTNPDIGMMSGIEGG